jgi:tRNA(fMet)-specific endonuclease VapC
VLWPDLQTCQIWADIIGETRDSGQPMSASDAWVAATALRFDLRVLTHDMKDFTKAGGLKLRPLPPAESTP